MNIYNVQLNSEWIAKTILKYINGQSSFELHVKYLISLQLACEIFACRGIAQTASKFTLSMESVAPVKRL